jgi:hypothetical protein
MSSMIFLPRNSCLATELKRGNKNNWGEIGEKGLYVY